MDGNSFDLSKASGLQSPSAGGAESKACAQAGFCRPDNANGHIPHGMLVCQSETNPEGGCQLLPVTQTGPGWQI